MYLLYQSAVILLLMVVGGAQCMDGLLQACTFHTFAQPGENLPVYTNHSLLHDAASNF